MKQPLHLAIPKPCTESWDHMTPDTDGRFCLSCQKQVIDFSTWDEERLKRFFREIPGKVCGRLRTDQLKRYPLATGGPGLLARMALLSLTGLAATASLAQGQSLPERNPVHVTDQRSHDASAASEQAEKGPDSLGVVIRGQVWEAGEGNGVVPGVSIFVKESQIGTITDVQGRFELRLHQLNPQPVVLVISFIGYETVEKTVEWSEGTMIDLGRVHLVPDITMLSGEVIIVGGIVPVSPLRRLWWKVKSIF
jgi:hypothetical protein